MKNALIFLAASLLITTAHSQTTGTNPVKIFILAGESNMHGKGTVSPVTTQGTLDYVVANDPTGKYQFLKSGGSYVSRTDVGIRGLVYSGAPNPGELTVGYGGFATGLIGPELGFGHVIGDAYENKVLIVKVGVDGTTLAHSFCPPSSRVGEPEPVASTDKGFYYKEIIRLVNEAKATLGTNWQIAGFGWHQGWNDRVTPAYSAAYETNMARLITDIRTDLATPNMPFVIASAGMDGSPTAYSEVELAQLKMANPTAYPAFAGNVATVDTRINYEDLEFWQSPAKSPANEGYHWNRSGKTYLHIGMAMGDAMSLLAPNRLPYRIRSSGGVGGTTLTWKNGTEMPTSVRVLRNGVQIAASAPANPASFVDASPPLGVSTYELQFTMPGSAVPPLTINHNSGVTNLVARLRVNGAHLSWQNNLGYAGLTVKRDGVVIAASLPGSTTSYVDIMPPSGMLSYTVEPTTAGSTPAQATLKVSAYPPQTALIYEPFDMTVGSLLEGQKGGLGLDEDWTGSTNLGVIAGSLSFGTLPTFGNSLQRGGSNGPCSINTGTTLSEAGLMADGAVLWFSFLHRNSNNINGQPALLFGSSSLAGYFNEISGAGSGLGVRIGATDSPQPIAFNAGTYSQGTVQSTIPASEIALIVGKITWGATPSVPDTIEIYTPGTNLVLDTPTSISAVLNQANFNVISMWGNGPIPEFDEIRFGASYVDVTGQGVNTSGDFTAPTPATMSFATPPTATSQVSITMTATAASDTNGVQYRFLETSGNPGATSSGWQDSPVYTDTGLNPSTQYTYTVQARDKSVNNNTNTVSAPASATTPAPDTTAPTPNPMSWATPPAATGPASITMTATTASDVTSVEYFFDETSGNPGATDSGWQSSPSYTDTGLNPSTQYTYQVRARDAAPSPNETSPSPSASATTQAPPPVSTLYWDGNSTTANADGGAGTWADLSNNWDSAATAGFDTAWNNANNDTAVFGGTAGTVTVGSGGVTVGSLQFTTANYIINGATLTLGVPSTLQNSGNATIQSVIAGNGGLIKSGAGNLTLSGTNTYTGTTIINAGTIIGTVANFLPVNSNVTVNSGCTLNYGTFALTYNALNVALNGGNLISTDFGVIIPGTFTLGTGTTSAISSGGRNANFSGNFTGSGNLNSTAAGNRYFLSGTNDYTGTTRLSGLTGNVVFTKPSALYNSVQANWIPANITVNSGAILGIRGGNGNTTGFTSAQIGTLLSNLSTVNNNGLMAGSMVNIDTTTAPFDYTGVISDSSGPGGGAVGVYLSPGSTLTLSGANTYSGKTIYRGYYASETTTLSVSSFNSVFTNPGLGTVHSASSNLGAPTTVANGTIDIGNDGAQVSSVLIYTGAGEITDRVLHFAGNSASPNTINSSGTGLLKFTSPFTKITANPTPVTLGGTGNGEAAGLPTFGNLTKANAGTWTIAGASAITGTTTISGGTLQFAKQVSLYNNNAANWTNAKIIVNSGGTLALNVGGTGEFTSGNVTTLLGNLTTINNNGLRSGSAIGFDTTNAAGGTFTIADTIANSTGTGSGAVGLTKLGTNTLVLTNANTYTGATTVTAGTLLVNGAQTAANGSVSVAANATFGGKGTLGGHLNIASGGKLTFDLSTPAASHDKLELSTAKTLTFTGASTLTITSTSGASPGLYTLVSGGNNIVGVVPAMVILPVGWTATPLIVGNELRLNVTSTTGSAYDNWKTTNALTGNPGDDYDSDGVDNAVEFLLGGTAATKDLGKLPTMSTSGSDMLITFLRAQSSIDPKTTATIELGTNLSTWPTPFAIPDTAATNNPGITVLKGTPAGFDTITLRVPKSPDPKKFARLKVVITP